MPPRAGHDDEEHRRRVTLRLMERGFTALDGFDDERALRLAELLRQRRHTSGFEIGARALHALGRSDEAAGLLRQGLEIAPELGVLWHWLGTVLSDVGEYDPAAEAFERSIKLGGAPAGMELANLALVRLRQGRSRDGLAVLERLPADDADLPPGEADLLWAELHLAAGDLDKASRHAAKARRHPDAAARAAALLADVALQHGRANEAERLALEALRDAKVDSRPLDLLRRARGRRSASAQRWRVMVGGTLVDAEDGELGFYRSFDVVADSADDALALVAEVEASHGCTVTHVEEAEPCGPAADEFCGVVNAVGGHCCFAEGDEA